MKRIVQRALAVAAVGLGLAAGFASPANAAANYDKFVNYNSEKCLDVTDRSESNGAKLQQYGCHSPVQGHQLFALIALDAPNRINAIKNLRSGKCLEVQNNSITSGARIVQSTCDADNNQRWQRTENPDGSRTYQVVSSGMCLAVQGGSNQNNAPVIQETCNGQPWQKWWEED